MSQPHDRRLDSIETNWSLIDHAHGESNSAAAQAKHRLLNRYSGAIWRYFLASTKDSAATEELYQEFALRLVRGDFHRVSQKRGRFRDYVKTVAINLLNDFYRRESKQHARLPDGIAGPDADPNFEQDESDRFLESWRKEVMNLALEAMRVKNENLYFALTVHAQYADESAEQKAVEFAQLTGTETTANHFRVMRHRSRKLFARMLRKEVANSIDDDSADAVDAELRRLRLLSYCEE